MRSKLNIGLVSPGWPIDDYPNGIVSYVKTVSDALSEISNPHIFSLSNSHKREYQKNVIDVGLYHAEASAYSKLSSRLLNKLYGDRRIYQQPFIETMSLLRRAIHQQATRFDLIEIEESFGFPLFAKRAISTPIVCRLHGPWFIHAPIMKMDNAADYTLRTHFEGEGIRYADAVTSPSQDVLNQVRDFYNIDLPLAEVIPNPVLAVDSSKQWQYDPKATPSILFVGRFDYHKGGDIMLQAFNLIAQIDKEIQLTFVGPDRGLTIDGNLVKFEQYLHQLIKDTTITSRINFLGHCDQATIQHHRQHSTLTVFPSRYENFPVSLLEALSTGSPTIATAVGGIKEIIQHQKTGVLVSPETPEEIASQVISLLAQPETMLALSKNAILDTKQRYAPDVIANQTLEYYKKHFS